MDSLTSFNDHQCLGEVHSLTMTMSDLARTIDRLHPDSPSRVTALEAYTTAKAKAKAFRDAITKDTEDRKTATWLLRTCRKPLVA